MSEPEEPQRPSQPPPPEAGAGAETVVERMRRMRTGSDEATVTVPEPEQPVGRQPRIARKEPGRRVRARAAREEQAARARTAPARPEPRTTAAAGEAPAPEGGPAVRPVEEATPDAVVGRLAQRLEAMRTERDWSLNDLARRSGVSRSTLSRVERGQISPTAAVLVRLAAAYDQTLSGLLAEAEAQPQSLVRAAEQTVTGEDAWRRRAVSPPFPGLRASVIDAQLLPGTDVTYEPPMAGAEQHLWLITGNLEVTLGTQSVQRTSHADVPAGDEAGGVGGSEAGGDFVLIRGDCLRLRLWGPARLRCLSPDPARYALVTVAP
ncbi:MAG TPA: helix-turn-helix transcriptional regulator [Micromonosporaceae bacterium]|jgi:transcriptional regulator with XRE-family HTH domain